VASRDSLPNTHHEPWHIGIVLAHRGSPLIVSEFAAPDRSSRVLLQPIPVVPACPHDRTSEDPRDGRRFDRVLSFTHQRLDDGERGWPRCCSRTRGDRRQEAPSLLLCNGAARLARSGQPLSPSSGRAIPLDEVAPSGAGRADAGAGERRLAVCWGAAGPRPASSRADSGAGMKRGTPPVTKRLRNHSRSRYTWRDRSVHLRVHLALQSPNPLCLRAFAGADTRNHNPRVGGSSPSSGTC
jgi:hypothetical protein